MMMVLFSPVRYEWEIRGVVCISYVDRDAIILRRFGSFLLLGLLLLRKGGAIPNRGQHEIALGRMPEIEYTGRTASTLCFLVNFLVPVCLRETGIYAAGS